MREESGLAAKWRRWTLAAVMAAGAAGAQGQPASPASPAALADGGSVPSTGRSDGSHAPRCVLRLPAPFASGMVFPQDLQSRGREGYVITRLHFSAPDQPPSMEVLHDGGRLEFRQPYAKNRIDEVGVAVPARLAFLHWIENRQLQNEHVMLQGEELPGQTMLIHVPCATIDL